MVVCLIALPILLFLGIFSASHRKLAIEAFECAVKKVTFKPCDLSLEQKLKKGVFGSILKRNEKTAFFVFKHFEGLSVVFAILMILSLLGVGIGVYNLVLFGNCNGPATSEFCVFNPETYSSGIDIFGMRFFEVKHSPEEVKPIELGDAPSLGNPDAPNQIIEVGCFTCPYTKAREPLVKSLLEKYGENVFFSFKYFPLPNHKYSFEAAASAQCAFEQEKFWEYKKILFEQQTFCTQSSGSVQLNELFVSMGREIGLDEQKFSNCINSQKYFGLVQKHKDQSIEAGIYGTPTFYVNGHVLVAPNSIEEFEQFFAG